MHNLIEVTSLSRPDENWRFIDEAGHTHQWEWPHGKRYYTPTEPASLPTCIQVEDPPYYTEDGDEIKQFHYECKECRALVVPGKCPDTCRQFIRGLQRG